MSRGDKQTAVDTRNEIEVAALISGLGRFQLRHLYQYAWADFAICDREGTEVLGFAEVRCKNAPLSKYRNGFPMSHEKAMRLFELSKWTYMRPVYLFARFTDGIWWCDIGHGGNVDYQRVGLMKSDRGNRGGFEVVIRIPVAGMLPIEQWPVWAFKRRDWSQLWRDKENGI